MKLCVLILVITVTAYAGVHIVTHPEYDVHSVYRSDSDSSVKDLYRISHEMDIVDGPIVPGGSISRIPPASLAPPANDNFVNRITMPGSSGMVTEDNADATLEPGEPIHYDYGYSGNTVWWQWTAPYSGTFAFNASGSAIDTIIAIYTGNSINALTRNAVHYGHHVYINAIGGVTYQVAVMSPKNMPGGLIVLDYGPTTISPWYIHYVRTNSVLRIVPIPKGELLYSQVSEYYIYLRRTNHTGTTMATATKNKDRAHGVTILDKESRIILNNAHLFPPGTVYSVNDYNGKYILTYNWDTAVLTLFRLMGQEVKKINERVIPDVMSAFISRSGIYVILTAYNPFTGDVRMGVRLFNTKLSKEIWHLPLGDGSIRRIYRNGVCVRHTYSPYHNLIEFFKKGEKAAERKIELKLHEYPSFKQDRKMNMLYWYTSGPWNYTTNSPLSYINKKGETVFNNVALPGTSIVWDFGDFDGKDLYVAEPFGIAYRIHKYRIRKGIKRMGETTVSNYRNLDVFDKKPVVLQARMGAEGFTQYNKKLSKTTWTESLEPGHVLYLYKGTYIRTRLVPLGSTTNFIFKLFNKKGTIATHSVIF